MTSLITGRKNTTQSLRRSEAFTWLKFLLTSRKMLFCTLSDWDLRTYRGQRQYSTRLLQNQCHFQVVTYEKRSPTPFLHRCCEFYGWFSSPATRELPQRGLINPSEANCKSKCQEVLHQTNEWSNLVIESSFQSSFASGLCDNCIVDGHPG